MEANTGSCWDAWLILGMSGLGTTGGTGLGITGASIQAIGEFLGENRCPHLWFLLELEA
jgi:hypothetical protein